MQGWGSVVGDVPVPRWPRPQLCVPLLPQNAAAGAGAPALPAPVTPVSVGGPGGGGVRMLGHPGVSPCGVTRGGHTRVYGEVGIWVHGCV